MVKTRRMVLAARVWKKNIQGVLVGKPEGREQLKN
jgi:hypothetical protein